MGGFGGSLNSDLLYGDEPSHLEENVDLQLLDPEQPQQATAVSEANTEVPQQQQPSTPANENQAPISFAANNSSFDVFGGNFGTTLTFGSISGQQLF